MSNIKAIIIYKIALIVLRKAHWSYTKVALESYTCLHFS